ncbi:MAG TPA: hypothetical protein VMY06_08330 [Sedimentisphaerales bacterium]|nr:hypothetical protein [Sedimentisphaerales bacterium]
METNEGKAQQNESCSDSSNSGGDCCSSGSVGWKSWKTAIFILVILAAGAVAARSVLTNGNGASSPCGAKSGCPLNMPCGSSEVCGTDEASPSDVTCPFEKKANNPSSDCPKTATPSGCPKTAVPSCCPQTGSN